MTDRPGRWYTMPPQKRDAMIVALKRRGWTHKRSGAVVGMTESGVGLALQRIRQGGFGQGMTRV